ncbi:hybrid sensor histidine kinase/response regulator [Cyanobacterium aponinum]|uniref:histidine kinase n=1 Tax=Cyanobacterium aponinum (strain PCC 10605) TaxID=755178 RepID=K9Z7Y2_CYAAP|nr:response regulator [Cyanobacterium aponinum]AFZ55249.1 CheA signal transduction histidine kinase [Cyanobacterium aponinum PCC 10605]
MDQEQIKMNFLDEAEECFDSIESALLHISSTVAETEKIDLALRAAHSVKGGAGMMGFMTLSEVAHRLEDFLKILRVHYHSTNIDVAIETLLLQSVDQMRHISDLYRHGLEIDENLSRDLEIIFTGLQEYLGELTPEDEDFLFTQNEQVDSASLMFEEGAQNIIDNFARSMENLSVEELKFTLQSACEQLSFCAQLAELTPVIELCQSIQQHAEIIETENIKALCDEAIKSWRRTLALVMRGSLDKLPSSLDVSFMPLEENLVSWDEDDLSSLTDALDTVTTTNLFSPEETFDENDLSSLSDALDNLTSEEISLEEDLVTNNNREDTEELLIPEEELALLENALSEAISETTEEINTPVINQAKPTISKTSSRQTVRISTEQIEQLNNLFGKLILERNRVNSHLEQLKNFVELMNQRMSKLEDSNRLLRDWYDRTSVADLITVTQGGGIASKNVASSPLNEQFDALEMDRYTDVHLISQGQIETIVQLKEVGTDINLELLEVNRGMQELNQTMRSLQKNVTQIQMRPFSDLVKGFPRLMRDLSIQYHKQVNLTIEGKNTLLDRTFIESLNAPMVHLIRNAFDHGIESPQTRQEKGKATMGNIKLSAVNRGTKTIITIEDDGAGINLDKISQRLQEMGFSPEQIEQMSSHQLVNHIFDAGFSTADQVTELSGRGVGMDVVRTNLHEIGGEIQVTTKIGEGTKFTLTVPFNSSILRVMIVESAGGFFAIPVNSVREVLNLSSEIEQNSRQITWQNQTIPLISLKETLTFNRPYQSRQMSGNPIINQSVAIVVGEGNNLGALEVEKYWGEQEVTIRPIESYIPLPEGVISSMILGDGRVLLLIDPVSWIQSSITEEQTFIPSIPHTFVTPNTKTILITDDSINIRRYLASTLEKAGYQVEEAKDGQEAVEKLLSGLSVQGMICDIEMPNLDGYGVLEEIKGKPEFQSLPIIMLTSRSNEKHRQIALNLGASAYFSKPYNEGELLETIKNLILS